MKKPPSSSISISFLDILSHFTLNGIVAGCVEKQFGNGKTRLDFYVYNPTRNFGVDVLSSNHFHNFVDNINHKIKRYEDFSELFYIVVFGDFTQASIDKYVKNRKSALPSKCKIVTFEEFQTIISSFKSYKIPIPEVN